MTERTDLPRIKPTDKPSFFNREAGGWGLLGSFVGSFAAVGVGSASIFRSIIKSPEMSEKTVNALVKGNAAKVMGIWGAVTAIGVVFGGMKGLDRQKKEQAEGRIVKMPTAWNSGIFSGWLVGGLLASAVNTLLFVTTKSPKLNGLSSVIGTGFAVGGMIVGSHIRKDSMRRDLDQSVAIRQEEIAVTRNRLHTLEQSVQYNGPVKPYAERIAEERSAPEQATARA